MRKMATICFIVLSIFMLGESSLAQNILNVAVITASDHDGNVPENTVDRSLKSRWSAEGEAWIIYELSAVSDVTAVNISFFKGNERRQIFAIDLSENGQTWKRIFYGESSGKTTELERYEFPSEKAKFIKIMGWGNTSNPWNSLTQFEAIGKGALSKNKSQYKKGPVFKTSAAIAAASKKEKQDNFAQKYEAPSSFLWERHFSKDWQQKWKLFSDKRFGLSENITYREEKGRPYIRVRFPAKSINPGSVNSRGTPLGGAQFYTKNILTPSDEMELSYFVRFSNNFDFVKGGKLPGLYGGDRNASGKRIPDGVSGFSTRFMWRANGDGEVYAYLPTSSSSGTSIGRGQWKFTPGKWHHIVQRIALNTPGKEDGQIIVYLDGNKVLERGDISFRTADSLKIDGLFFSTFFGGSDPSWATPKDVYIDYADFKIAR